MKVSILLRFLFALLLLAAPALAQVKANFCTEPDTEDELEIPCADPSQTPPNCVPADAFLPMFCDSDSTLEARFGILIDNDGVDLRFDTVFPSGAPVSNPDLFFVDGPSTNPSPNERRIGATECFPNPDGAGEVCRYRFDLKPYPQCDETDEIAEDFDVNQNVINFSLRDSGGAELCLGKFSNSVEKLYNQRLNDRALCNFRPFKNRTTRGLSLSGKGSFDPRGYGRLGDSQFAMQLEGFPTRRRFAACKKGVDGNFRRVFSFQSYQGESDQEVYGANLSPAEQALLQSDPITYSYDFSNFLEQIPGTTNILLERSLSKIGLQISPPAAARERVSAVKSKSKAKKRKKRKRTKRRSRGGVQSLASDFDDLALNQGSRIYKWLAFDPLVEGQGQIYIANSCQGRVRRRAYGEILCGASRGELFPDDQRSCVSLDSTEAERSGTVCIDPRRKFNQLLVRVEGLAAGSYQLCLNGAPVSEALNVETLPTTTYGELELIDRAVVAARVPSASFFDGNLREVSEVSISSDSCTTTLLRAEL